MIVSTYDYPNGVNMDIPQNKRMWTKYQDKCGVCHDCKNLCSPQAKRCMNCRGSEDIKEVKMRLRELAIEQGWNLKFAGLE